MKVLITGADGFIGRTLKVRLAELDIASVAFVRGDDPADLAALLAGVDAVAHLAGENRPADPAAFMTVNHGLTQALCDVIRAAGRAVPIVYASSTQAGDGRPYGTSKQAAEDALAALAQEPGQSCAVFRFPNVFGKWARPNYNSAVATFCHNIARDLPIRIDDPAAPLTLAYVDDVVSAIIGQLRNPATGFSRPEVAPVYQTTVGEVAEQLRGFHADRPALRIGHVGQGLTRALYATYISYLEPSQFHYSVPQYADPRGVFVEVLKTPDCGQFSFFTAAPGISRGSHYHHTKTEKFVVVKGRARFDFRNLLDDSFYSVDTSAAEPCVVDTIPGWSHQITNIGEEELVVMLWVNEVFDRKQPDTVAAKVR